MANDDEDDENVVLTARVPLPRSGMEVLLVTLNRPAKKNCFDARVCRNLATIFRDAADEIEGYDAAPPTDDDDENDDGDDGNGRKKQLAAIILTGAGPSFCAGADLSDPPNPLHQSSDLPHRVRWNPVHQMERSGVPIIGALRGHVSSIATYDGELLTFCSFRGGFCHAHFLEQNLVCRLFLCIHAQIEPVVVV
mmetsp:Transcript_23967/g.57843  ORF Transcript_23967/g.57843 Transcript_23967/m.57843 type:complete len:194 (-) Transcript_23967:764-1345(-)